MREHVLTPLDPVPRLATGDVVTLLDGPHQPIILRHVTDVIIRAAPGANPQITHGATAGGEDPTGIRVMDGCDRTQIVGIDVSGAYHGIRITGSANCKILHCFTHDNEMEGMLCGAVPGLEIGFCLSQNNGGGNNDRAHGIYAPSYNTDGASIHDCYCRNNSGSGLQVNGTAEIGGLITNLHVWDCVFEDNGVEGTPNLSIISTKGGRFRRVATRGGRGGMRIFADGGKASTGNQFFDCHFEQAGTSFSCDFQERTRATTFDSDCTVSGPEWTASGGSSLPRVVTAERQAA